MFKKKTLVSALALTAVVSFNQAAALTPSQVQQTKSQISTYQKQQNYSAAEQLIRSLMRAQPDQAINYVYLASNQYKAGQYAEAKQTLDTMVKTKDTSKLPSNVIQSVNNLYKLVAQKTASSTSSATQPAATQPTEKKRVVRTSQPKSPSALGFGVALETGFDSNDNAYPNAASETDLATLQAGNLIDAEQYSALYALLTLSLDAQSKSIAMGRQSLVLGHDLTVDIDSRYVSSKTIRVTPEFDYQFSPVVKTGGNFFSGYSLPITLNYVAATDAGAFTFKAAPTLEFAHSNSVGYEFAAGSSMTHHTGFYRYDKTSTSSFLANVFAEARSTLSLADVEENTTFAISAEFSATLKPSDRFSMTPSYKFESKMYTYTPPNPQPKDQVHTLGATVGYQLSDHFDIGAKFNQKIHRSTDIDSQYFQTIMALQIGWAN